MNLSIQLKDGGSIEKKTVSSKKPYLFLQKLSRDTYLAYDRYRFQLISDDPEEVLPEEDMSVLKGLNVVYLNVQETNMVLMNSEKKVYVYNLLNKELIIGPYKLPNEIEANIVIDEKFSKVQNKISQMQGGLPKFKLLN